MYNKFLCVISFHFMSVSRFPKKEVCELGSRLLDACQWS